MSQKMLWVARRFYTSRRHAKLPQWPPLGHGANTLRRLTDHYGLAKPVLPLHEELEPELQAALRKLQQGLTKPSVPSKELYETWKRVGSDLPRAVSRPILVALFDRLVDAGGSAKGAARHVATAIYLRDQDPDHAFRAAPLTVTSLAPWLWSLIDRGKQAEVIAFWHAAQKELRASNPEVELLFMPLPFLSAIVAAHALSPDHDLRTFLLDFVPLIKVPHRATSFLDTGRPHDSVPDRYRAQGQVSGWMKQVELAILWSRHGNEGVQGRARRWADRRLSELLVRAWEALKIAAGKGAHAWLRVEWQDKAPSDAATAAEEATSEEHGTEERRAVLQNHLHSAALTPTVVGSFLLSFLRLKMRKEAEDVWIWLRSRELQATPHLWHSVILGHGQALDADAAQATFEAMDAPHDVFAHAVLARAMMVAKRDQEGLQMMSRILDNPAFRPIPTAVMNRLLTIVINRGLIARAWSMVDSMPKRGKGSPSIYTINTLLNYAFGRRREEPTHFNRALKLLETYNIKPDVVTYSTLLQTFLADGKEEAAEQLVQQMAAERIEPNERIYAALIHHHVAISQRPDIEKALGLFHHMELQGLHPNEYIYSDIIRQLCVYPDHQESAHFRTQNPRYAGWPDHLARALWLFDRAKKRGVPPNSIAYNTLVPAFLGLDTPEGLQQGLALFDEMREATGRLKERGRGPPLATWYVVLQALADAEEWRTAAQVVRELDESGWEYYTLALKRLIERIRRHSNSR
jgi:pentatricopeptide repeat protein